ncbi:MAG TPA: helix-turn-helix transcriptional regulator [Streptosporangiaceae bacterium]|jgi:transcriptional regulator with XRE-family HTH domain
MPERGSTKVGRRRLAAELRRLRDLADLTGEEVADRLGWSGSKISRIELNRTEVKAGDLTELLDLYGVHGSHRADLVALSKARRSRGWWSAYSDVMGPEYAAYIELEAEADSALCWSPQLIHGLVQTEEYARAVIESNLGWQPTTPPGKIQRLIEVRLARQRIVTDSATLRLTVILDQSVLLRQVGAAAVMRRQLDYLGQVSRRPNVTLRVLPLAGFHPVGTGSFSLLVFPPLLGVGPSSDVLYVEQLTRNEVVLDEEAEVYEYRLAFEQLAAKALSPDATRQLIAAASEAWS